MGGANGTDTERRSYKRAEEIAADLAFLETAGNDDFLRGAQSACPAGSFIKQAVDALMQSGLVMPPDDLFPKLPSDRVTPGQLYQIVSSIVRNGYGDNRGECIKAFSRVCSGVSRLF